MGFHCIEIQEYMYVTEGQPICEEKVQHRADVTPAACSRNAMFIDRPNVSIFFNEMSRVPLNHGNVPRYCVNTE